LTFTGLHSVIESKKELYMFCFKLKTTKNVEIQIIMSGLLTFFMGINLIFVGWSESIMFESKVFKISKEFKETINITQFTTDKLFCYECYCLICDAM
jgi:hypothetical protein